MLFVSEYIGKHILNEISNVRDLKIIVAYFSPDEKTLNTLKQVPHLDIVVSEEFTINNPDKLEKLKNKGLTNCIPPYSEGGRLHAKVIYGLRDDNSSFVFIGSANLTHNAFFSNRESVIKLDSRINADSEQINRIVDWIGWITEKSNPIDFKTAKKIFVSKNLTKIAGTNDCWVLKTTSGSTGVDHWNRFLSEGVIAIGWEDSVQFDPSITGNDAIVKTLKQDYSDYASKRIAYKIRKFVNLKENDIVIICKGYPNNSHADVYVYGLAIVKGKFLFDEQSNWWKFKHKADIQVVNRYLPKKYIVEALGKNSMLEAIHRIEQWNVKKFIRIVQDVTGISLTT